jgi:hypothetical protein
MEGNLWFIIKLLPYLGFCCLISGFVGWTLRARIDTNPAKEPRKASSQTKPRKQRP